MFGAFKPSARLSGGLLWKIPWRLSPTQKLRQRRRLRRVDNIVEILDTALKRASASSLQPASTKRQSTTSSSPNVHPSHSQVDPSTPSQSARHGGGLRESEVVLTQMPRGAQIPSSQILSQNALEEKSIKLIERWKAEMPREEEMLPRDKYSMFDKKVRGYRKGVHKLPKWTRVSQRVNPPGF